MAAKPVDTDTSVLAKLADHAQKLLHEFVELGAGDKSRAGDLLSEFEYVISEFRRLRPPPTFRRSTQLRLILPSKVQSPLCAICWKEIDHSSQDSFETPGAAYHLSCYGRAIGSA